MTAAIVVGYTATPAGADALALGGRLAVQLGSRIHVVTVLPSEGTRSAAVPPERAYENHLRNQAKEWLATGIATLPDGVTRSGHVRFAESFAEGLGAAAGEFGASLIVVGAAVGGVLGRHRVGSVASELLHSAPVPVALAPAGTATAESVPMTRITAAVGQRAGADALVEAAARFATDARAALRLISLVPFDVPAGLDTAAIRVVESAHADEVLTAAQAALPHGIDAEVVSAEGDTVEDAMSRVSFTPGEILLVGSSRLAQPRRLFLGSTAAKMLHVLPVPMIVVPRTGSGAQVEGDRS